MQKTIILLVTVMLLISTIASAKSIGMECVFTKAATLKDGLHDETLTLNFVLDFKNDKYVTFGNNGRNNLNFVGNDSGFTLIEITGTGNVMTTTVDTVAGALWAVHSRNTIVFDSLIAQQYYGQCRSMGSQP